MKRAKLRYMKNEKENEEEMLRNKKIRSASEIRITEH